MSEIIITKKNFEEEALRCDKPVLIDFWASWCGPCKMLAPVISEIASECDGSFKVGKINVDDEPELAAAFNVASIPTVIVIKDGKTTAVSVGYRSKEDILSMLKK